MTSKFINLLTLILLVIKGQLYGQVTNNPTADSVKAAKDRELVNEYFERHQNSVLRFENAHTTIKLNDTAIYDAGAKSKFIILCFNLSKSYEEEISALNKIAKEYENQLSSLVIKADELNKYKEIFTSKEFKSLQTFIYNKSDSQKRATSFPVILILNKNGKVLNAWSGDKTEDGLKKEDYYAKIKAGLETMQRQK
jgi:hypothetical protein